MIPYREIPSIPIFGPIGIHPFGFLVAAGILFGTLWAMARARKVGIDPYEISGLILWASISGFVGAHLVAVLFYFPDRLREDPLLLLRIWDGLSSFGGYLGGSIGMIVYLRLLKKPMLPRYDLAMQCFVAGWILGRLGCTIAFDHPGVVTDFFLAMPYKDGQLRHNLGFYEFLFTALVLFPQHLWLNRRKLRPRPGSYTAILFITYAPARFYFDMLRATDLEGSDRRYAGMTPGQWGAIVLLIVGVSVWIYSRRTDQSKYIEEPYQKSSEGKSDLTSRSRQKTKRGRHKQGSSRRMTCLGASATVWIIPYYSSTS